jgi:hypothetical protein
MNEQQNKFLDQRKTVTAAFPPAAQQAGQQSAAIGPMAQRIISSDTVLVRYARTHLQLCEAEEENARLKQFLNAVEQKYKQAAEQLERCSAALTAAQGKLTLYEENPGKSPWGKAVAGTKDNPETAGARIGSATEEGPL